jgi:hypothetical protein
MLLVSDINNMARGNIDKSILAKAKKACKTVWEKSTQDNFIIAENYTCMSVFNKINFNAWLFLFTKVNI